MAEELLIRIDENVCYLRKTLDEHQRAFKDHVDEDKRIVKDFMLPLWNAHQQELGKVSAASLGGKMLGYCIGAVIAAVTAWAAVKGVGK